jgi:hypothetical protein
MDRQEEVDSEAEADADINVVRWVEDLAHMEAEIDDQMNIKIGNARFAGKEITFKKIALPARTWGPRMSP